MIELEHALAELAEHLDHPAGDRLPAAVRDRLSAPARSHDRRRHLRRSLLAVAAVFVLVVMALVAIAPARQAIADWLGIGAVEIRRSTGEPAIGPSTGHEVPGDRRPRRDIDAAKRLAAARTMVQFAIATPAEAAAGPLFTVETDRRVPGGLVALAYDRFTVTEIASLANTPPPVAKVIGAANRIENVTVNAQPGFWIDGAHDIGYLDRAGNLNTDTLRRAGPVLIWEHAGVTYRIEGLATLDDAQRIAESIG